MEMKLVYFSKFTFLLFFLLAGINFLVSGTISWGETDGMNLLWYGLFLVYFLIDWREKQPRPWSVWKITDGLVILSTALILLGASVNFF